MPHFAAPDHAQRRVCRRHLPHNSHHGAQVVDGVVGSGATTMRRYPLPPIRRRRPQLTEEAKAYARTVAMLAKADGQRSLTGPVAVTIAVHRGRHAGDLVDFVAAVATALAGVLYGSEAQIRELRACLYDDRTETPRVEVEVISCR